MRKVPFLSVLLGIFVAMAFPVLLAQDQSDGATGQSGEQSQPPSPDHQKFANLVYETIGTQQIKLDIYRSRKTAGPLPLLIWIHGGGWRAGGKGNIPILHLASDGFVIASINYRLTGEAPFPAQIEDVKSAIRWLRAHASDYGIDPKHIGLIGHSVGGHLASLAALTGRDAGFDVGDNLNVSSGVQAVCDMSGPSNIVTMFDGANEWRRSALVGLLGGGLPEKLKLAQEASPVTYVHAGAPPFLIIHGQDDPLVPVQQALDLSHKLEAVGDKPQVIILPQAKHNYFDRKQEFVGQIRKFFATTLGKS